MTQYIGTVPESAKQEVISVTSVRATDVEDWHEVGATGEPAYGTDWSGENNAAYSDTEFYKDPYGVVYIRGLAQHTTAGTGTTIFYLPVGYRPPKGLIFTTQTGAIALAQIRVHGDGRVDLHSGSASIWVSLSGISFRV